MPERRGDQADGLRRLFGQSAPPEDGEAPPSGARPGPHVVAFAAAGRGLGKSALVANLAAVLGNLGRDVLVVDENKRNSISACFGLNARHDWLQSLDGDLRFDEVTVSVMRHVRVLPAAQAVKRLGRLDRRQEERLRRDVKAAARPGSILLVDTSPDHPLGFSPFALAAHDTAILVSSEAASITEAYALVKKVSLAYARRDFRLLVNQAKNADEAEAVHANMARVCAARKIARLTYAGCVPLDEHLRLAGRHCRPIVELFPESPSAQACRVIADTLLAWSSAHENGGGLEHFVQQLLHLSRHIDPVPIYA